MCLSPSLNINIQGLWVPVCPWSPSHFASIFPSWLFGLWMSSSIIRCEKILQKNLTMLYKVNPPHNNYVCSDHLFIINLPIHYLTAIFPSIHHLSTLDLLYLSIHYLSIRPFITCLSILLGFACLVEPRLIYPSSKIFLCTSLKPWIYLSCTIYHTRLW